MNLSVVIATHNEATHLPACLQAIAPLAEEVIIVDGASTDNTVAIAQDFGAVVIKTTNKTMFHTNKQMGIEAAKGEWILQLDADEVVDNELKIAILNVLSQEKTFSAYALNRKNYFLGRFLTKGGQYPDQVIRFFQRGKAWLPQRSVHEQMEVEGSVGVLSGHLLHYNAPTFARYITNANRYSGLTAADLYQKGVALSWIHDMKYLVILPIFTFVKLYVRHRGYCDGFPGFVFALFSGMHHALAYMKLRDIYARRH